MMNLDRFNPPSFSVRQKITHGSSHLSKQSSLQPALQLACRRRGAKLLKWHRSQCRRSVKDAVRLARCCTLSLDIHTPPTQHYCLRRFGSAPFPCVAAGQLLCAPFPSRTFSAPGERSPALRLDVTEVLGSVQSCSSSCSRSCMPTPLCFTSAHRAKEHMPDL
jgi:hypothetical protein